MTSAITMCGLLLRVPVRFGQGHECVELVLGEVWIVPTLVKMRHHTVDIQVILQAILERQMNHLPKCSPFGKHVHSLLKYEKYDI